MSCCIPLVKGDPSQLSVHHFAGNRHEIHAAQRTLVAWYGCRIDSISYSHDDSPGNELCQRS